MLRVGGIHQGDGLYSEDEASLIISKAARYSDLLLCITVHWKLCIYVVFCYLQIEGFFFLCRDTEMEANLSVRYRDNWHFALSLYQTDKMSLDSAIEKKDLFQFVINKKYQELPISKTNVYECMY